MIIEFIASLSDTSTAICVGGEGAKVKFDIPESELPNVLKLVLLKGTAFKVKIETTDAKLKPNSLNPSELS